jgi:hypothetical protein
LAGSGALVCPLAPSNGSTRPGHGSEGASNPGWSTVPTGQRLARFAAEFDLITGAGFSNIDPLLIAIEQETTIPPESQSSKSAPRNSSMAISRQPAALMLSLPFAGQQLCLGLDRGFHLLGWTARRHRMCQDWVGERTMKGPPTWNLNAFQSKIAMEACGGAHHWARQLTVLGHTVRLIPPQYVKPYVKRSKNDRNDAEAICEAAGRPGMHFVPAKSVTQREVSAMSAA